MFDFLKWNSVKLDAAPGTLVYAGEKRDFTPSVTTYSYRSDKVTEECVLSADGIVFEPDCINFLIATGIHQPDMVKGIGAKLSIPPLFLEDVLNTGQRPHFVWADDDTGFIVMKHMMVADGLLKSEQVSLFWRDNLVVAFLERESDLLDGILARIHKGKGRIRNSDSSYLMVAILDALVDQHMLALARFGEAAQALEGRLSSGISDDMLGELYELKRETILLRNTLVPIREIFKSLLRDDTEISEQVHPFLVDVVGHHEQTLEGATALHDILKSMIDYQISLIGIRTNKVMQLLTVIATIFIPLTFIVGVYGMNFKYMPELEWYYGYYIVMAVMGVVGVGMFFYFYRKKML
ncbi:magnesium/cobalt transporter CorA [Pseudodesulfovibrio portus]|uniref:Magnesium transport protein CorA n=1 Tax=Pseudodesulfovibrio portus TaxID=231439 RepID=A0ABM8AQ22_9BACT|nr:magnesium/cobalt transporter CorA [Pseudodesulfovibrio portus]BDQ33503.1 magnesium transport protein CorA [Pseudodesulfovibrio portus]